jgi:sulfite reductase alpha subunit-like flavoprotein
MFFGCRRKAEDNLYETDWENVEKWSQGNIKVVTAFSREQENKVYVQDKIRGDSSKEVWDLISRCEAKIFVAGSSEDMPARVREAIRDVCAKEGGMDKESATRYIAELEAKRRYFVEAW